MGAEHNTTREKVRELHAGGLTGAAIAAELGISKSTVAYHLRRLDVPADDRFRRRYDWDEVQAYHDEGHSARECQAHFGMSAETWHSARRRGAIVTRPAGMPIDELLGGRRARRHLRLRLQKAGLLPERCEICGIDSWLDRPLSLQLHHINGEGDDNRLENLQILCPNCHSQTDTWGGRNRARLSLVPPPGAAESASG